MKRRTFLKAAALAAGEIGLGSSIRASRLLGAVAPAAGERSPPRVAWPFEISLAEWSLEKSLFGGKLQNLDFPRYAKAEFGIDTVEYVDQFFKDKAGDVGYLAELKKRCEGEGVRSGLIMVDTAGALGAADAAKREAAVSSHRTWLDAAKSLGCHAMRVNARGDGAPSELRGRVAESCAKLAEHAAKLDLNLTIENHGGPSSDPVWLAAVMKDVNSPWFGTLPDFGNFPPETDRYDAVAKLMPFAKAVSAKTHRFDAQGNELDTDYARMMRIVLDAGYRGYVGIECEGAPKAEDEPQHIRFARAILEKFRAALPPLKPLFNGKDLDGWVKVAGGEWAVDNGTILARNGVDWSTDPSRTGSWLRTEKEYGDFELFLEYSLGPKTNSGVFFRSGLEKNPAFTGYEVQIYDDPGSPPRKSGPGALYDVVAPSKNRVRPAGEWNQIRVIAKGQSLRVHVNGEMVVDVVGDRRLRGYIGLQNHDAKSEVRFREIWLAEV
jgi:L-ribulose-5-phosphate 3-epimerase